MVVMIVMDRSTEALRGQLTRWMLEVKAGVFVGTVSVMVRDLLWEKVKEDIDAGAAMMIYPSQNEQGFSMEMCHSPRRSVVDFDGLYLVKTEIEPDAKEDCNDSTGTTYGA